MSCIIQSHMRRLVRLADDFEADFGFYGAAEHLYFEVGEALVAVYLLYPAYVVHEGAAGYLYLVAFDNAFGDIHHAVVGLCERVEPRDIAVAQRDEGVAVAEDAREGRHAAERLLEVFHLVGYDDEVAREQRTRADDPFAVDALLGLVLRDEAFLEDGALVVALTLAHADMLANELKRTLLLPRCHLRDVPHESDITSAVFLRYRPVSYWHSRIEVTLDAIRIPYTDLNMRLLPEASARIDLRTFREQCANRIKGL